MSLTELLLKRIATQGPMRINEFMHDCLLHPEFGYYTQTQPFGAKGDFITAPEISQMFGELIGLCLAQTWMDQGAPKSFTLLELGPGRGTLMADILRATKKVPGFHDGAEITLLEASKKMCGLQKETLRDHNPRWISQFDALKDQPIFAIANEFFDALPIQQFQRGQKHWHERHIAAEGGKLIFGWGPKLPQPALDARFHDANSGDLIETCSAALPFIHDLSEKIKTQGGAALIIDYGDWHSLGDTLQAVQDHQIVDPLSSPGQADLTAHVDFEALSLAATCPFTRITPQGVFLERLGITQRAQALAANLTGDALNSHIAAHRRLTHPEEMGNLFKVMGLYPEDMPPPAGLEI